MGTLQKMISFISEATLLGLNTIDKVKKKKAGKPNAFGSYLSGKPQYHGNPIFFPKHTKMKGYMKENRRSA